MNWLTKFPKKLTVLLLGAVVQLLPFLDQDTKNEITKWGAAYIIGQGVADFGKERAKIEQQKLLAPRAT